MRRPADAPELERKQGSESASRGDHGATGHAALIQNAVQAEGGEVVGEQEQAAELRAQRPGPQVQLALVRDGGGPDAALLRPASA